MTHWVRVCAFFLYRFSILMETRLNYFQFQIYWLVGRSSWKVSFLVYFPFSSLWAPFQVEFLSSWQICICTWQVLHRLFICHQPCLDQSPNKLGTRVFLGRASWPGGTTDYYHGDELGFKALLGKSPSSYLNQKKK